MRAHKGVVATVMVVMATVVATDIGVMRVPGDNTRDRDHKLGSGQSTRGLELVRQ